MKKLMLAIMVLMLSSCMAPVHMKHLRPVPVIVYNSYPCSNIYFGEGIFGWYYDNCDRMWFPRHYLNRGYIYRGEPRFVQPIRSHQPPPVRREEPRPEARRPRESERRPEVRQPRESERRPEARQPKQQQPQPRRRSQ